MPHITAEQYAQAVKAGIIKPESTWYKPKEGEVYWYSSGGCISAVMFHNDYVDKIILPRQQVFGTKAEAEKEDAKRIALTTIKRWCAQNVPFTPDWKNGEQEKWYVGYAHHTHKFVVMLDFVHDRSPAAPYLATKADASQLINLFDKELRIIFEIE